MALLANYDPTQNPSRIIGWYDTDAFTYATLPTDTVTVPEDIWNVRTDASKTWQVLNGAVCEYVAPAPTKAEIIAGLKAQLATIRYGHEIGGVSFQPSSTTTPSIVATDETSQQKVLSAYVMASNGLWQAGALWKMADGAFIPLTAADAQSMGIAVSQHVSLCFNHESDLSNALETADDPTTVDLTVGWPGQ